MATRLQASAVGDNVCDNLMASMSVNIQNLLYTSAVALHEPIGALCLRH